MTSWLFKRATLVAVVSGGVVACADQDMPTETETVRLAIVSGAAHGGAPLATALTQEVFSVPTTHAGDPDGTGEALITVNRGQREICWEISVSDIRLPAMSAHIHRAPPGVQGPIVVPLSAPQETGVSTGCASGVSRDLLREILESPESFYVNVHTSDFPPGAIRGQLAP